MNCGTGTQYTTNICNLVGDGTGLWGDPGCPNSKERTYRECRMPDCDKGIHRIENRIILPTRKEFGTSDENSNSHSLINFDMQ